MGCNYELCCETTADRKLEFYESRNIKYTYLHFHMEGREYNDDIGQSISPDEFYKKISEGVIMTTSQINPADYVDFWRPMLESGRDVLHISLSSGISGTYSSAKIAAEELSEEYPDRKIYAVDSLAASAGYGLLMEYAADKRDEGLDIDELRDWVLAHRLNINHWFFSTDLTSFKRGGRISATEAFLGTALRICPLMNVDYQGRLIPREKIRLKKKTIVRTVEIMRERALDGTDYAGKCIISMSACRDDALHLIAEIEKYFPNLKDRIEINDIGAVIGSHTGPGTVALFYYGKERETE